MPETIGKLGDRIMIQNWTLYRRPSAIFKTVNPERWLTDPEFIRRYPNPADRYACALVNFSHVQRKARRNLH